MAAGASSIRNELKKVLLAILWSGVRRRKHKENPTIFAVVGSVGKTSTKEALATVLQQGKRPVEKSFGNMATDTGLALSLTGSYAPPHGLSGWIVCLAKALMVRPKFARPYWALEYSSDIAGDTKQLTDFLRPDVAIVTTITPVHMELYKTEEVMIEETLSIIPELPKDGVVIANADDAQQVEHVSKLAGERRVIWYGIHESKKEPGVWAHSLRLTDTGMSCKINLIGQSKHGTATAVKQIGVQVNVLARYQLYPLLAAAAAALLEEFSLDEIKSGIQAYQLPAGRGRIIPGRNGVTIIDDSGNASPDAVIAGLEVLAQAFPGRRRVAVIGNMNELGEISAAEHGRVGAKAGESADLLMAVGPNAGNMARGAEAQGMPRDHILIFKTAEELLDDLDKYIQGADVVFVKASQNGMYLERVVEQLMLEPARASELLFRQEAYWKAKRK